MRKLIIIVLGMTFGQAYAQEVKTDSIFVDSLITNTILIDSALPDTLFERPEIVPVKALSFADSLMVETQRKLELINPGDSSHLAVMKDYDILIFRNWEVEIVRIKTIRPDGLEYLYPFNTNIHLAPREEISQIHYAGGKREIFYPLEKQNLNDTINMQRVVVLSEKAWEQIIVVKSLDDLPPELLVLKTIETEVEGDRINTPNKKMETSALIILRKKTLNAGGTHLYISEQKFNRPYGDIPYVFMEGKVYGIPPAEE